MAYDAVVGGGLGAFLLFTLVGQSLARLVGWSDSVGIALGVLVAACITYRFYRHEKLLWEKGEPARKIDGYVRELVHSLQEIDRKNAGLYDEYTGTLIITRVEGQEAIERYARASTVEEVYGALLDQLIQCGMTQTNKEFINSCVRITMSISGRNGFMLTDILYYEMVKDGAEAHLG